ncbi:hypothetical protein JCGZ_16525 [Jatropha curcas]|uniref:Glycine-rich protein n=1 Tax=Jatropha curcas TaxID=180498 RepID=A0A067JYU5_JATCU|nr:hypothetical protein JCGZ_16525 [Jatropha curcas]
MKLIALFFIMVVMVSSCLAIHGQGERNQNQAEGKKSRVDCKERSVDNHHSIPREYYNGWGSSSQGDKNGGDNGGDEGGQP